MTASFNACKAPDLKNNSVGVGKGMPVASLNGDPVIRTRDDVPALPAADIFFFFQYVRFGFFFNRGDWQSIILIFSRYAKPKIKNNTLIRYTIKT